MINLSDFFHKNYEEYLMLVREYYQDNSYLSFNVVAGDTLDAKLYLAMQILDYALVVAPGAKLKKALIDNPDINLVAKKELIIDKNNRNEFFKLIEGRYRTHTAQKIRNRIEYVKNLYLK